MSDPAEIAYVRAKLETVAELATAAFGFDGCLLIAASADEQGKVLAVTAFGVSEELSDAVIELFQMLTLATKTAVEGQPA